MSIVKLKGENSDVEVEITQVKRIRSITGSEKAFHTLAETRIDYLFTLYVKDMATDLIINIGKVAPDEAKTLGRLTLPNKMPVWFWGPGNAVGPLPIPPSLRKDGIQSALRIAGKIQYVRESPDVVHRVIQEAQGATVPPIDITVFSQAETEKAFSADNVWDSDIPELQIKMEAIE